MQILLLPLFVGILLNGLSTNPHSVAEFNAAVLNQLNHPVVVAEYKTNGR